MHVTNEERRVCELLGLAVDDYIVARDATPAIAGLSAAERAVCEALGVAPQAYKAHREQLNAAQGRSGFVLLDLAPAVNGRATAPTAFRMFRAGWNETKKGGFLFDERAAQSVMAAARDWDVDHAIDYAHAMLDALAPDPATAGRAAGWFSLEVRDRELWATNVRWTDAAAKAIAALEWRYVSPAFVTDRENRITEIGTRPADHVSGRVGSA